MVNSIPQALVNATLIPVPNEFRAVGDEYTVKNIYLAWGPNVDGSKRQDDDVLVNLRCSSWTHIIPPPICCKTSFEAIVLRFLHEVGHHYHKHSGDEPRDGGPATWADAFDGKEGEAWTFALEMRANRPQLYAEMVRAVTALLRNYNFGNQDWETTASEQFKKAHNLNHLEVSYRMPQWVFTRYGKYFDRSKYKNLRIE